eukprot:gnl/MRDRNA2_/MRDRNA2_96532_c0_seq1.p1 gnl/MRDRNA2_/MRDRNA2_96532_c0~~gnl/MRDRNA2_/MRDRNA2_96532_c0_seq1.p1  ORF type:complete len:3796 (-),score=582.92 gnl/MRDRNA2_/MRDRNA2_96532_c0_seq1:173-9922(-)
MSSAIDTKTTIKWESAGSDSVKPTVAFKSTDEYHCFPSNGVLPDVTLYMNEDISHISKNLMDKYVKLYDCGTSCDVDGDPSSDTEKWKLLATDQYADEFTPGGDGPVDAFIMGRLYPYHEANCKDKVSPYDATEAPYKGRSRRRSSATDCNALYTAAKGDEWVRRRRQYTGTAYGAAGEMNRRRGSCRLNDRNKYPPLFTDGSTLCPGVNGEDWEQLKVHIDSVLRFKVTLDTDRLANFRKGALGDPILPGEKYQLFLEADLFTDQNNQDSAAEHIELPKICEAGFDSPVSKIVRVYPPTALASTASGPRAFHLMVDPTAVKDTLGNSNAYIEQIMTHETDAPTATASSTDPLSVDQHLFLTFNEVVQAGAGSFDIYDTADDSSPTWSVNIADVNTRSSTVSKFSGNKVSITPKTLCDSAANCSALDAGKTYYVLPSAAGVVKDAVGTAFGAVNTQSIWTFKTESADTAKPEIAFLSGQTIDGTPSITGYIYFTEKVQAGTAGMTIQDCGTTYSDCASGTEITSPTLSFGDGSTLDGLTDYGLLKYTKALPTANRRYRVTLPADAVKDTSSNNNAGPTAAYTFYISSGTAGTLSADTIAPSITSRSPTQSSVYITTSTDIILHFNEDIQAGTGTAQFCLNSDAALSGSPACTIADYSDESDATFDMSSATISRRQVTLNPSKDLKVGQKLYMLLPAGSVQEVGGAKLGSEGETTYSFTVIDADNTKPSIQYVGTPSVTAGSVVLYFSEAVQSNSAPAVNDVTSGEPGSAHSNLCNPCDISGNKATVYHTSTNFWTKGNKYRLNMLAAAFKDLAGNTLSGDINTQTFKISPDDTAPTHTALATTVSHNDAFTISFNEVVQRGTGKLSIYSQCSNAACTSGTILTEIDVLDLPSSTGSVVPSVGLSQFVSGTGPVAVASVTGYPVLTPGTAYSLYVPSTCFKDVVGKDFIGLKDGSLMTATTAKDSTKPALAAVDMGAGGSPNPRFEGSEIAMYFTEQVQVGTTGSVKLVASDGGNSCDGVTGTGFSGACPAISATTLASPTCSSACGYGTGGTEVLLSTLTVKGSAVFATVPVLTKGKGYKLVVDAGTFKDLEGNSIDAVDGESDTNKFVLERPAGLDVTGPEVQSSLPASGGTGFVSSTTLQVTFNEVVQAGTGSILFETTSTPKTTISAPVTDCFFQASVMVCDPPGYLDQNTEYKVSFLPQAVQDIYGSSAATFLGGTTDHKFTTLDLDVIPPLFSSDATKSLYALDETLLSSSSSRRLLGGRDRRLAGAPLNLAQDPPFVPGDIILSKAAPQHLVLQLSFSETVQAAGSYTAPQFLFGYDCNADHLCDESGKSATADSWWQFDIRTGVTIHKTSNINYGARVYYTGKKVLMDWLPPLAKKATYKYRAQTDGTVQDASGGATPAFITNFTIVGEDEAVPVLIQNTPIASTTAVAAGNTNIVLHYSESMQAASAKTVTMTDGTTTVTMNTDGTTPAQGTIQYFGPTIFINPASEFGYDKQVTVTVAQAAFKDVYGINSADKASIAANDPLPSLSANRDYPGASVSFSFKTQTPTFTKMQKHNTTRTVRSFAPRAEAVSHYIPSHRKLMMYGGRGRLGECFDDVWTSNDGKTWTKTVPKAPSPGKLAGATISSVDKNGCVWIFGGQCDPATPELASRRLQEFNASVTSRIWKTCDLGSSWSMLPIPWIRKTLPEQDWAKVFTGHSIIIVGGWQLVIVDAMKGVVWRFTNLDASEVEEATRTVPWIKRRSPHLLSTSTNEIYLTGGDNCASYSAPCARSSVFMDVWSSADVGSTWKCLTASYGENIGGTQLYTSGLYKATAAMTYDDTMWLLAGRKPNSTAGLQTVYSSLPGSQDLTVSASPYLTVVSPKSDNKALPTSTIRIFFREAVQKNSAANILFEKNNAGNWGSAGASIDVSRQIVTITPSTMSPSGFYRVKIPTGALTDASGNTVASFTDYTFEVHSDGGKASVASTVPAGGTVDVSPDTNIILTMNELVKAGSGSISLTSPAGIQVSVDVSEAFISGTVAAFPLGTLLTQGQVYTVNVPDGLLKDERNINSASTSFSFTVISGTTCTPPGDYTGSKFPIFNISNFSNLTFLDVSDPVFVDTTPLQGATDVPAVNDTAMVFHFSKQVFWNDTGVVSILNSSGFVLGTLNKTRDSHAFKHDIANGTRLIIGASGLLKAGQSFTVSAPAGMFHDIHGVTCCDTPIVKSFTCLDDGPDPSSPVLATSSPYEGQSGVFGSTSEISVFFSKPIQHGTTNNILIKRGAGDAAILSSDNATAVTIDGSKLTVKFAPFATAGLYGIEIPLGTLTDCHGNPFMGINTSQLTFNVNDRDTTPPTLSGSEPVHEGGSASYTLPTSPSISISFSETIQAGVGNISLVPTIAVAFPTVVVDVNSALVGISDTQMVIAPPESAPGEVYNVILDKGVVKDLEGNEFAGIAAGYYRISTAPLIRFSLVGDSYWSDSSVGYFDGPRYSPNVIIDGENNIFVIGGYNGTAGHAHDSALNDVWKFVTMRHVNCHSHHLPQSACSKKSCDSPSKRGTWSSTSRVWKPPTNAGTRCVVNNWPASSMNDATNSKSADCPCPMCLFPPDGRNSSDPDYYPQPEPGYIPMPTQMVNYSYTKGYTMVSAALETRPLLCRKGFHASGPFVCGVNQADPYSGQWQKPYPYCIPDDCPFPPPVRPNQHITSALACNRSGYIHGEECEFKCDPGWVSNTNILCSHGMYGGFDLEPDGIIDTLVPTCNRQLCSAKPEKEHADVQCTTDDNAFETLCKLQCHPGYYYDKTGATTVKDITHLGDGGDIAECYVLPGEAPETAPRYHKFGSCKPRGCGDLNPAVLAGGTAPGEIVPNSYTTKIMGGTVNVTCPYGYEPVEGSTLQFTCAAESMFPAAPVMWKGSFECVKRRCPPTSALNNGAGIANGNFVCTPGDNLYQDVCQLVCEPGYTRTGGDGAYTCDGFAFVGTGYCEVTKCSEPPLVENADSINCTGMVDHKAICVATCKPGYAPQGEYECNFGVFISEPVCIPQASSSGGEIETQIIPYLISSLSLRISRPPGEFVANLATDEVFKESTHQTLAENLPSAAILGITQSDVTINSIILVPETRLLQESSDRLLRGSTVEDNATQARRLQDLGTIRVDYKVRLKDKSAVYQLTDELVVKQKLFKQQIKSALESIPGLELTVLDITIGKTQEMEGYRVVELQEDEEKDAGAVSDTTAIIAAGAGAGLAIALGAVAFVVYKRRLNAKPMEYVVY